MPEAIEVRWTPIALQRLDEIYDFIARRAKSTAPAEKLIDKLFNRTDQLGQFPLSGQEERYLKGRGLPCRYLLEGNYKIVYEYMVEERLVAILDVFHTDRSPENILK
jgi:plasmid stabilization system protein ParE